jgi:hypothetical protein
MPSRKALLAMAAPPVAEPTNRANPKAVMPEARQVAGTPSRQRQVWDSVAQTQESLAAKLGTHVKAPQSESSLQLSLENAKLRQVRASYVAALEQAGLADGDVVGFVVAINGKPASANVYPSNGLFRKLWAKQLAAVVTEAIGDKPEAVAPAAPPVSQVQEFLAAAEQGKAQERTTTADMRQETRDGDRALYNEARKPGGSWVHKNYLAK